MLQLIKNKENLKINTFIISKFVLNLTIAGSDQQNEDVFKEIKLIFVVVSATVQV